MKKNRRKMLLNVLWHTVSLKNYTGLLILSTYCGTVGSNVKLNLGTVGSA